MLWEVEIHPAAGEVDREGARVLSEAKALRLGSISAVRAARSFLIEGDADAATIEQRALGLLVDSVVETCSVHPLGRQPTADSQQSCSQLNVMLKPGVTDNVALSAKAALTDLNVPVATVATVRKYWLNDGATDAEVQRLVKRVLSNDAIEHVVVGPLAMETIGIGG